MYKGLWGRSLDFTMAGEGQLEREIMRLEAELREREASLPAHSVRAEQLLAIEELESAIAEKKKALAELRRENEPSSDVD
jgi:hypothetical protein